MKFSDSFRIVLLENNFCDLQISKTLDVLTYLKGLSRCLSVRESSDESITYVTCRFEQKSNAFQNFLSKVIFAFATGIFYCKKYFLAFWILGFYVFDFELTTASTLFLVTCYTSKMIKKYFTQTGNIFQDMP